MRKVSPSEGEGPLLRSQREMVASQISWFQKLGEKVNKQEKGEREKIQDGRKRQKDKIKCCEGRILSCP